MVADGLASHRIDVNAEDGSGLTALMHAILNGHAEVVKALLTHRILN